MKWLIIALAVTCAPAYAQTTTHLAHADNQFAVDLYGKLARTPGNIFFSPYSVAIALGTMFAGAEGPTADQMANVLHVNALEPGLHGAALRAAYAQTVKSQPVLADANIYDFNFQAANALWIAQSYRITPTFLDTAQSDFGSQPVSINFSNAAAASRAINRWVADKTDDRIKNVISREDLRPAPQLVITNAVYFKAKWTWSFDPKYTINDIFHPVTGPDIRTDIMHIRDGFLLTQVGGTKILSLPYGSDDRHPDASLVVILPKSVSALTAVEARLNETELDAWIADAKMTDVVVALPKFHAMSSFNLNNQLAALGMPLAFDSLNADFNGVANGAGGRLFIGAVIHRAFVDVSEDSTEAAAATVMGVVPLSAPPPGPPPPPPVRFIADHPFIYLIRDNSTGIILFMGRMDDPSK